MKKSNIYSFLFSGLAMIYDAVVLALFYMLYDSMIIRISSASGSTGIIGGADIPTLLFVLTKIPVTLFMALFIIFGISTVIIITVASFKKSSHMSLYITAIVFLAVTVALFVIIPPQAYAISVYRFTKKVILYNVLPVLYYVITGTEILIICQKMLQCTQCERQNERV